MRERIQVLYVDDYQLDRELVKDALEREHGGFEVVEATHRQEFEHLLKTRTFDTVLSDFNIAGFEGLQVIEAVRAYHPDLPVIIVTGTGSEEIAVKALKQGAADYVIKHPTHIRRLPQTILAAIEKQFLKNRLRKDRRSLKESERRYRSLFENMINGCAYCRMHFDGDRAQDFIYIDVNRAFEALTGLENVIGKKDSEVIPGIRETDPALFEILGRVARTGVPETLETYVEALSMWFSISVYSPAKEHFVTVLNNIDERKRAEEGLRQSEARLRLLKNTIPDLVWIKDPDGVYLGCNPTFELFFGANESEIIGKTDYDFKPKAAAHLFREQDRKAMEAGGPSVNEEHLTFAGNKYQGVFETIKTPMRDSDGRIAGTLGIARDITQRKKAEDALKESEQRYKKAQRIGQVGNWEYDIRKKKFWGSDEAKRIFGYGTEILYFSTEQIEGCILERERVHRALVDLIENDKPYDLEHTINPRNGSDRKTVRSIAEVVSDGNGTPRKVIGVIQDISEQKKAEAARLALEKQLRQSQKMESIGSLAGGIAHDFNNILSAIIGYTELALEEAERRSPLEEDLQEVFRAGQRAKNLVNRILAFARQSDEEVRPVRVDRVVEEVLTLIRSTLPTTIEIQHDLNSDSTVMGNSIQIHQVLMNLCTNAAHAMEENGGVLQIGMKDLDLNQAIISRHGLRKPGSYLQITVSDTGKGIAPGIIHSIFDPYFTTKEVGEGTGLGLAVVHGIVKSYGGVITASSEAGKGSVFTIYLPVARTGRQAALDKTEVMPTGTERILFVDDEVPIAKMGKLLLTQLGYSVTARTSSVEALELFKAKSDAFDLVITDMTMPNMTGDMLARELIKVRPDVPVIICTGYSKKISERFLSETGIKALAYKPIVKADIARIVRKVLNSTKGTGHPRYTA